MLIFCLFFIYTNALALRSLGQFGVYSVSFLRVGRWNSSVPNGFLASAFGALSGDALYYVPQFDFNNVNNTQPVTITNDITWPNEPEFVPSDTIPGYTSLVAVGSGFLVPGSETGYINIMDFTDPTYQVYTISQDKSEWFYHRVRWYDVDKDGLKDIITSRANKPLIGSGQGELVWYKQPQTNALNVEWAITHIANGPDFLFELIDVNNDGVPEIIAAEYFGQALTLTYSTTGDYTNPSTIKQITVDSTIGNGFDVHVLDVNGDGKDDLVATNHQGDGTGAVFAYEIPANWQQGNWPRHVLASGFPVTEPGFNQASPGAAIPFYPQSSFTSGRGWIALGGDGSQCAYELRPNSATGWDYSQTTVINTSATVGQIAVGDLNNDGYVEVFVPAYDTGIVYVYTYSP